VLVVLFLLFSGVLGGSGSIPGLGGLSGGGNAQPGGTLNPQSDTDQQLAYIVDSIQTFWASTFQESGKQYPETKLVLFEGSTDSSCGPASAATGPFYCPADQKVYLDLGFFDELQSRFGASGGDFAMAYVVAHEFGHHIQTVLGISEQVQSMAAQDPSRQNDLSVRQELQADCLAGVWANSAATDVQPGDVDEALSAAAAVGDDRIQESTTGRIDPENWTHGSAEQRTAWFTTGYRSGNADDCDTFAQ
jgi:predicted metalloprotease